MLRPFKVVKEDFAIQQPEQQVEETQQQENQVAEEPQANTENNVTDQTPEVIDGEKASKFSNAIVISAMPALGKSTYSKDKANGSLDLESSLYSRNQDGTRNEEFPGNYINVLKWHLVNMNWKYIFVACHQVVRDNLRNDKIDFITLYPSLDRKEEILNLCRERGNHEDFIKVLDENWEAWINQIKQEPNSYELGPNEFISNELFETKLKFLKR